MGFATSGFPEHLEARLDAGIGTNVQLAEREGFEPSVRF